MRSAAVMTVLVATGLLAGAAAAQTVPIPPVPTVTIPTVTVPTSPVAVPAPPQTSPAPPPRVAPTSPVAAPLPTIPKLPTPALPAPTSIQDATTTGAGPTALTVPVVSSGAKSTLASPSTLGGGSAGSASTPSGRVSDPPTVKRLRSSRRWIFTTGPKGRRVTTLTFMLPRAGRVIFFVKQISPVCRVAGQFAVNGRAGRNRVRFPGRASKLQLDPGTYRITARTRGGRVIQRVIIVVVDGGAPSRDQIMAARAANVCIAAGRLAGAATGSTGASNTRNVSSSAQAVQRSFTPGQVSASGPAVGVNSHSGAVLASSIEKAARVVRPLLVALLALAILLLAVASLPRQALADSRANELLAQHRMEIAGLGTAAFVAVVIAFVLG